MKKIVMVRIPSSGWWAKGMPVYNDNPFMQSGNQPNPVNATKEWNDLVSNIQKIIDLEILPFPSIFDKDQYNHDFIFIRDSFISDRNGKVVLANFREPARKIEPQVAEDLLIKHNPKLTIIKTPGGAFIEGGEFFVLEDLHVGVAGVGRSNIKGVEFVTEEFNLKDLLIIKAKSFHIDTVFSILTDENTKTVAFLVASKLVENIKEIKAFAYKYSIQIIEVDPMYSVGISNNLGSLAINGLAIQNYFISGAPFDLKTENLLKKLGIRHIVSPTTEFVKSGGSVHCLTNEL